MPGADPKRILLVDDVAMFRELGALFLARTGTVDLAESAEGAFRIARERPPKVVIADMHLPDLPGTELCRRFKASGAEAPQVVLLARPESEHDHAEAVRAGADEVLFRPLERDSLITNVRRLTEYEAPQGLPRAELEIPVEITARGSRIEGRLRNLSRGGLFIEAPLEFQRSEEVALRFELDGVDDRLAPTAQVVWCDGAGTGGPAGVGLRFLEIDARTAARLEHYVHDHFPRTPSVPGTSGTPA